VERGDYGRGEGSGVEQTGLGLKEGTETGREGIGVEGMGDFV
jgi:hypothetical protein